MNSLWGLAVALLWLLPFFAVPVVARQCKYSAGARKRCLWLIFALGVGIDVGLGGWMLLSLNAEPLLRAVASAIVLVGGVGLNVWSLGAAMDVLRHSGTDAQRQE